MVPSKVLIPIDGSPASLRALDFAIEMAGQNPGTSLVLLNVQNISAMDLAGAAMGKRLAGGRCADIGQGT